MKNDQLSTFRGASKPSIFCIIILKYTSLYRFVAKQIISESHSGVVDGLEQGPLFCPNIKNKNKKLCIDAFDGTGKRSWAIVFEFHERT